MPHLIIECAASLDDERTSRMLEAAHKALLFSGVFDVQDVKSRVIVHDRFKMGEHEGGQFVHALLHLIEGRSADIQRVLADAGVHAITSERAGFVPAGTQISCDVRDIPRATYAKHVVR